MESSSSLQGYCSATLPMPAHHMNRPYRLPLSHPFSPPRQLFTMPHRLSTNHYIEPRRTLYKKPSICWRQFSNMGAQPSLDISAAGCFRIASAAFLQVTIASMMSIPKYAGARGMENGSSSNKIQERPTIPGIITERLPP
jgi:hypothetical protein